MDSNSQSPILAIWMITYNQEKYISGAIEGVLNQKTNFKIKLFIGDDCSTDNTTKICKDYEEANPEKISVIINSVNNIKVNAKNIYDACFNSGAKYIAMCEGDDYWIHSNKLQKQIDFLENNPDYSICIHRAYELFPDNRKELGQGPEKDETYTIDDLSHGNFINTVSVVFRNGLFQEFPSWFYESPAGDYVLHMLNARYGKIKYFSEPMAVYRHGAGIWSTQHKDINYIRLVKLMDLLLLEFQEKQIRRNLILQKIKYLKWIEKWPDSFNPSLNKDEVIELINEDKKINKEYTDLLNNPSKLASSVSLKTLMRSLIKKLSNRAVNTPRG